MKKWSSILTNLIWDGLIFIGTLIAFSPRLTGENLHEWIGLAFGITLLVHVLLHWRWIVGVTKRFIKGTSWQARIYYLVGVASFIAFTLIIFSGLMQSKAVLGTFGLQAPQSFFWKMLHSSATKVTIWLAGLHIALTLEMDTIRSQKNSSNLIPRVTAAGVPVSIHDDERSLRS